MGKSNITSEEIAPSQATELGGSMDRVRALTGGLDFQRQLYPQLHQDLRTASSVDIVVSFLMQSGVKQILGDLRDAVSRGVPVRILTSDYLGITEPAALFMLRREFGNRIDLRLHPAEGKSFHAKSYILHQPDGQTIVYVGSSNLSRGALTSSIEWNYRLDSTLDLESAAHFSRTFRDLFENHAVELDDDMLARYAAAWKRPPLLNQLAENDSAAPATNVAPRDAQIEALYALEQSRAGGAERALIHAATGIGKTYLAAFDSLPFRRVLFVAHREEILGQAAEAFAVVRPHDTQGMFAGDHKTADADLTFASVATLGKKKYLNERYFASDAFDYIVIDEFHHATANQYRRIQEYFKPKFLLGLTATPERMDRSSVYALCDYNVPYELPLPQAINRGILVPFRYYGIYDGTDYQQVERAGGKYSISSLTAAYTKSTDRADLIFGHYDKHSPRSALGFCCSQEHAENMAQAFRERGVPAVAVHAGTPGPYCVSRREAIEKLRNGGVVFCVDMFNEGVDVPDIDMVMFLRPTESPVVFLQQLGRGLRRTPGKDALIVLDFIGNYVRANQITTWLAESVSTCASGVSSGSKVQYPEGCEVDFDLRLIDLFREMEARSTTKQQRIEREYHRIQELLDGRRPTRYDMFTYMDEEIYRMCVGATSTNIFRDYLGFLKRMNALTDDEIILFDSPGREFINMLETTSMTRVYKMPVLSSLYNGGDLRSSVTMEQILATWKAFFSVNRNWRELPNIASAEDYAAMTDRQHMEKIRTMPVKHLLASSSGLLIKPDNAELAVSEEVRECLSNPALGQHMGDVLQYRTQQHYRSRYLDSRPA